MLSTLISWCNDRDPKGSFPIRSQDKINIKNLVCVLLPQHDLTFSTKNIYYLTKLIYDQVCKLEQKKKKKVCKLAL